MTITTDAYDWIVQPMLSGQTTSLSDLFNGLSPDTIVANAQSTVSNIGTALDPQSSQLSSVGSTMQTMMSSLSVFSGAGTILGPLIEMTGPGIMSTLFQLIGNTILNSIIMPLVSQFTSTVFENDINTLTSAFGGINQTVTQLMNIIIQATSIIDQSGTTKQTYGSGSTSQSTSQQVNQQFNKSINKSISQSTSQKVKQCNRRFNKECLGCT